MLSYTSKDFDALRDRLFALIRSKWPKWTDTEVTNFGNILVELFAFVGDVLCFYQDAQANEAFIATAQQRRNLLSLAKLVGYVPSGASAAQATVTLAVAGLIADCVIPLGSIVRTNGLTQTEFQILSAVTLTPAVPSATAIAEHSRSRSDAFASDGLPNQEFVLSWTPFLDGSLAVSADDGAYVQVTDFLSSAATDRHFVVVVDDQDVATVRFGNGVSGAVPVGTIACSYRTGGGADGNVDAGTLTRLDGSFADIAGHPVTVTVTNAAAATGGVDRETKEQIRILAPASLRTNTRTVAHEDFLANGRVPGVARIAHLTRDNDPAINQNASWLFVVPTGAGWPTGPDTDPSTLLGRVKTAVTVTYPCMATHAITAVAARYVDIDVYAKVFLRPGATAAATRTAIVASLAAYFALTNTDGTDNTLIGFGVDVPELPLTDLLNAVRDAAGVRKVDASLGGFLLTATRVYSTGFTESVLPSSHADVPLALRDFPRLHTVTLINGDTGAPL